MKTIIAASLAPALLLLSAKEANAKLTYNIFESAGDVVIQATGNLNLDLGFSLVTTCGGAITTVIYGPRICTGEESPANGKATYRISGPQTLGFPAQDYGSSARPGISLNLLYNELLFAIDADYASSSSIISGATIPGITLGDLGLTTSGLIATWNILDSTDPQNGPSLDTIEMYVSGATSPPSTSSVPAPLPLLGVGAAFSWSRRIRQRIRTTPSHQA